MNKFVHFRKKTSEDSVVGVVPRILTDQLRNFTVQSTAK